jgi:hypothetical protein
MLPVCTSMYSILSIRMLWSSAMSRILHCVTPSAPYSVNCMILQYCGSTVHIGDQLQMRHAFDVVAVHYSIKAVYYSDTAEYTLYIERCFHEVLCCSQSTNYTAVCVHNALYCTYSITRSTFYPVRIRNSLATCMSISLSDAFTFMIPAAPNVHRWHNTTQTAASATLCC